MSRDFPRLQGASLSRRMPSQIQMCVCACDFDNDRATLDKLRQPDATTASANARGPTARGRRRGRPARRSADPVERERRSRRRAAPPPTSWPKDGRAAGAVRKSRPGVDATIASPTATASSRASCWANSARPINPGAAPRMSLISSAAKSAKRFAPFVTSSGAEGVRRRGGSAQPLRDDGDESEAADQRQIGKAREPKQNQAE